MSGDRLHSFCRGTRAYGTLGRIIAAVRMRRGTVVHRFGDFELDPASSRLLRGGQRVPLGQVPLAILIQLVHHAPGVVPRDELVRAVWGGTASRNSVEKAISVIRQALGSGITYIETVPNRGYRFAATVHEAEPDTLTPADDEALRPSVAGDRELMTLNRRAIESARRDFQLTIERRPEYGPARTGLANAYALLLEASRFAERHDLGYLNEAIEHARLGTTLAPASADAWSTQAFVLYLAGDTDAAIVAACQAISLAPGSWRHWLRRAYIAWGDQRIEAAQTVLTLHPRLALAHWLNATVLIARGAFDAALRAVHAGSAAQDPQPALYPAVGLHLLRGLVLAARDQLDEAGRAFDTELATPDHGQLYWQECASNTWYAIGAIRLRQRDFAGAEAGFRRALEIAPGHLFSLAALGLPIPDRDPRDRWWADAALARAVAMARGNRHHDAAQIYADTIAAARFPNTGWTLPVEPLLRVQAHQDVWARVLTIVEQRAT